MADRSVPQREILSQQQIRVFVRATLPRTLLAEVHLHIRGHGKLFVFRHFQSAIPRQRAPQGRRKFANVFAQCRHDKRRILRIYRRFYREPAAAAREEVFLPASFSAPLSISIEPLKSAPSSIKICAVVKFPFTEPPFLISIFPVARTFPFT
jgi:hypothetical protein